MRWNGVGAMNYRHRPTPVRAWQWDGTDDDARRIGDAVHFPPVRSFGGSVGIGGIRLSPGWWLVDWGGGEWQGMDDVTFRARFEAEPETHERAQLGALEGV